MERAARSTVAAASRTGNTTETNGAVMRLVKR
jgi:hypothetical protein